MPQEKGKGVVVKPQTNVQDLNPESLKGLIKNEKAMRKLMTEYIASELVEEVDYGKIHVVGKDKCPQYYSGCDNPGHYSKDTLFKAGSEKFISLFHLKPVFEQDFPTWEMLGKPAGTFCFICRLVDRNGEVVAEGRGACSVGEKYGQVNNAIKIAEKRSQLDAVLRQGALSDFFTQDLEDMEQPESKPSRSKKTATTTNPHAIDGEIVNPVKPAAPPAPPSSPKAEHYECEIGAEIITKAEYDYSKKLFKKALCRQHQKEARKPAK